MNFKCLIGLHKYPPGLVYSGDIYIKTCDVCGYIHIFNDKKLEKKFNEDYNNLQILYDLARHNIKCHNRFGAEETFKRIDSVYDILKVEYLQYRDIKRLRILYDDITEYRKSISIN